MSFESYPKPSEIAARNGFTDMKTFAPFMDHYVGGMQVGAQAMTLYIQSEQFRKIYYDNLTGLPNRAGFFLTGEAALEVLPEYMSLYVCLADVNGLKEINDNQGHDAGDEILKGVADKLSGATSAGIVTRLHGDEFAIICPSRDFGEDPTPEQVADWQMELFRGSCGVAVGRSKVHSVKELKGLGSSEDALGIMLKEADAGMYKHKRSQRGGQIRKRS